MGINLIIAQPCTTDPNLTSPGLYPDTVANLPVGAETQAYEAVIRAVVPADTQLYGNTVHIDSIGVLEILGLPGGFTYACGRPSCYILGGTQGCVVISGTPAVGQAGTYPLGIKILIKANFNGMPISMPDTITGYKIIIQDQSHAGFEDLTNTSITIYPNPAGEMINVELYSSLNQKGIVSIVDLQGKILQTKPIHVTPGFNTLTLPVDHLNSGVYFIKTELGTSISRHKVVVRH